MEVVTDPTVPLADQEVKETLRRLQKPIHVFAETPALRRGRLRQAMILANVQSLDDLNRRLPSTTSAQGTSHHAQQASSIGNTTAAPSSSSSSLQTRYRRAPAYLVAFREELVPLTMFHAKQRIAELKEDYQSLRNTIVTRSGMSTQPMAQPSSSARDLPQKDLGLLQFLKTSRPHRENFWKRWGVRDVVYNVRSQMGELVEAEDEATGAGGLRTRHSAIRVGFSCMKEIPRSDGWIVTGAQDGVVTMWNVATGAAMASGEGTGTGRVQSVAVCLPHGAAGRFFCFSVRRDSHVVDCWEYPSAAASAVTPAGAIRSLTKRVAIGSYAAGTAPAAPLNRLAIDSSGCMLAVTSDDCLVRLYDILREDSPAVSLCVLDGYQEARRTFDASFHPDSGSLLAVSDGAGRVTLWDTRVGSIVGCTGGKDSSPVHAVGLASCVAWSPCGLTLASGGTDNMIFTWDIRKVGAMSLLHGHMGHRDVVTSLQFVTGGGTQLDSASSASTTTSTSSSWFQSFRRIPHSLLSTSLDGTIRAWDALGSGGGTLHCVAPDGTGEPIRGSTFGLMPASSAADRDEKEETLFSSQHGSTEPCQKMPYLITFGRGKTWTRWSPSDADDLSGSRVTTTATPAGAAASGSVGTPRDTAGNHAVVLTGSNTTSNLPPQRLARTGDDDANDDDDDDEDEMTALRNNKKRAREEGNPVEERGATANDKPTAVHIPLPAVAEDEDDDDDDMALLRKKK